MLSRATLKRFDRDFDILQSLQVGVYSSIKNSRNRHIYHALHRLIRLGLISSKSGHGGGYRLTRGLDDISLSCWYNQFGENINTPTGRLLRLFITTSVEQLLHYPPYPQKGGLFSLDHVVLLLNILTTTSPTRMSAIRYCSLTEGYMKNIFLRLARGGAVRWVPGEGALLRRPFDTLMLKDIALAVPLDNCRIFSGMVRCVADLNLYELLPMGERA